MSSQTFISAGVPNLLVQGELKLIRAGVPKLFLVQGFPNFD